MENEKTETMANVDYAVTEASLPPVIKRAKLDFELSIELEARFVPGENAFDMDDLPEKSEALGLGEERWEGTAVVTHVREVPSGRIIRVKVARAIGYNVDGKSRRARYIWVHEAQVESWASATAKAHGVTTPVTSRTFMSSTADQKDGVSTALKGQKEAAKNWAGAAGMFKH